MYPELQSIQFLGQELSSTLIEQGDIRSVPAGTEIIREGQFIKSIPVVLKGLLKVFTSSEEKDLLLYYIQPGESCVMSFSSSIRNEPSMIRAVAEEDSMMLLLRPETIKNLLAGYPELNMLFLQQYRIRYTDLIQTIQHLVFNSLDKRIMEFLQKRRSVQGSNLIKLTHKQIAAELGTAREVVSRVLKKLETEGKLKQESTGIIIL